MDVLTDAVRLPSTNDSIAPVRILDADGHLVCVLSADEFRRTPHDHRDDRLHFDRS
jgi:hypothetical protein